MWKLFGFGRRNIMDAIKGIIGRYSSRKLIVTALAGIGVATGVLTLTLPVALVIGAYLVSQAIVDTWGG
jgi:hypothetical protein